MPHAIRLPIGVLPPRINAMLFQIFVHDFQAAVFGSYFQVSLKCLVLRIGQREAPERKIHLLEAEVEVIALRLARFDHGAIARTKSYVDQVTLPDNSTPRAKLYIARGCV